MARNKNEMVTMFHPETKGVSGKVTYEAWETVWKDKGWELVEKADLSGLTRAQLETVAEEVKVDVSEDKTKTDVVKHISEGFRR